MIYKCRIKIFKEKIGMELSEIIKTIRSELNLSQEGLARELRIVVSSLVSNFSIYSILQS